MGRRKGGKGGREQGEGVGDEGEGGGGGGLSSRPAVKSLAGEG